MIEREGLLKRVIAGVMLAVLLIGVLILTLNVQPIKGWTETIYIKADGLIQPPDAPIITSDNITYTLTDNITSIGDGIVVERDNIIIDGDFFALEGTGLHEFRGIDLPGRANVTVRNVQIKGFCYGINLNHSTSISIVGSNITNNAVGIMLHDFSNNNIMIENKIAANNYCGIHLDLFSNNNSIIENDIANNAIGIQLSDSGNNSINRNVFTANGIFVLSTGNNSVVNNTINGKPLVYLEGVSNYKISDAGEVILVRCNNITVESLNLSGTSYAVQLLETIDSIVSGNNITFNRYSGIVLWGSHNNSIRVNKIIANGDCGIYLCFSENNSITENDVIANGEYGINLEHSSHNIIYHNNFINNTDRIVPSESVNVWDNGYPSGGNYWSDYTGTDLHSGSYQNETGSDGIGDAPYFIGENNGDHYPLMGMFYDFEVTWYGETYCVEVTSNSTVSDFKIGVVLDHYPPYLPFLQVFIEFYIEGEVNVTGFCRVTIPRRVINNTYTVLIDYYEIPAYELAASNTTHAYLYFTYEHSEQKHEVIIVPEFTSTIFLLVVMISITLATIAKKKPRKDNKLPISALINQLINNTSHATFPNFKRLLYHSVSDKSPSTCNFSA